jgi:hypothetical protein
MKFTVRERPTRWVAVYEHTEQVGFEQSQTYREVKVLTGDETIKEVVEWAGEAPNILIAAERTQP